MTHKEFVIWLNGYLEATVAINEPIFSEGIDVILNKIYEIQDIPGTKVNTGEWS